MVQPSLVDQLLAVPDPPAQRRWLRDHHGQLDETVAPALKAVADQLLRADVQRSLQVCALIEQVAALRGDPCDRALGLLAEANARTIGLGEYPQGIELYDQAAAIYDRAGRPVDAAQAQVGKVGALAYLGRYADARQCWEWAAPVLEQGQRWQPLAGMTMNLAIMYARKGEDATALTFFNQAADLYERLGEAGRSGWLWVQLNRALVLRNLGHFQTSIEACQTARQGLAALGQPVAAARAQQNLALTYFILGRHNEALKNLQEVGRVFAADGRQRDAVLVDLFISNCLLQLRRFREVLDVCRQVRTLFAALGAQDVAAKAILNEGVAHAGLGAYDQALQSLRDARRMFAELGNVAWMASAELETAAVLQHKGDMAAGLATARRCIEVFRGCDLPMEQAQACLVAARAALALGLAADAQALARQALAIGVDKDVASLRFEAHRVLGALAASEGDLPAAQQQYRQAIDQLERLRGHLMVEFRAAFLEDKTAVYEDMVSLQLALGQPLTALEYAERAKSRALVDMLAYRLDLGVVARDAADQPIVEELQRLRAQRDQIYRRWQSKEELQARGASASAEGWQPIEQDVLGLEVQITRLWHTLLVRNADYARDAALWRVQTEPIQPFLAADTALLEFYAIHGKLVAFAVTRDDVLAIPLDVTVAQVNQLQRLLRLNLDGALRGGRERLPRLIANAQGLLRQFHDLLIARFAAEVGEGYAQWIIVPHGPLHYLPFAAFFDGQSYLLQRHAISYLPGASLLRHCQGRSAQGRGLLALGHSFGGRLPHTLHEAQAVAGILGGDVALEDAATPALLQDSHRPYRVLHLATHGDFRADNPLFSGLALAGGWLTTLDIFGLRLDASLVTLSACQTGRHAIGGGDELLGLMRAFLHAGAASLVLSLWPVEDASAARLMEAFYRHLAAGRPKGAALREAQLGFLPPAGHEPSTEENPYAHPYFWAPFYLVGDPGPL